MPDSHQDPFSREYRAARFRRFIERKPTYTVDFNPSLDAIISDESLTIRERLMALLKRRSWGNASDFCVCDDLQTPFTQADVVKALGCAKSLVSRAINELIAAGYLKNSGRLLYVLVDPRDPKANEGRSKVHYVVNDSPSFRLFLGGLAEKYDERVWELARIEAEAKRIRQELLNEYKSASKVTTFPAPTPSADPPTAPPAPSKPPPIVPFPSTSAEDLSAVDEALSPFLPPPGFAAELVAACREHIDDATPAEVAAVVRDRAPAAKPPNPLAYLRVSVRSKFASPAYRKQRPRFQPPPDSPVAESSAGPSPEQLEAWELERDQILERRWNALPSEQRQLYLAQARDRLAGTGAMRNLPQPGRNKEITRVARLVYGQHLDLTREREQFLTGNRC